MKYTSIFIYQLIALVCKCDLRNSLKQYHAVLERLVEPTKLVFDVTKLLHNEPGVEESSLNSAEILGFDLSPTQILYYGGDVDTNNNGTENMDNDHASLPPPSFIFGNQLKYAELLNSHSLQSVHAFLNASNFGDVFTAIFNFRSWKSPITREMGRSMEELTRELKNYGRSTKVGIELDNVKALQIYRKLEHNKFLMYAPIFGVMGKMDVIILNIDIPFEEFILSYSQFKISLREVIDWIYNSIQLGVAGGRKIYAKINLLRPKYSEPNSEFLYGKYALYLLHYSVLWINDGEKEELILEAFMNMSSESEDFGSKLKPLDMAEMNALFVMPIFPLRDQSKGIVPSFCHIKAVMDHAIKLNFKGVTLNARALDRIHQNVDNKCVLTNDNKTCGETQVESYICRRPTGYSTLPGIHLKYDFQQQTPSDLETKLGNISESLQGLNWKSIEFDFNNEMDHPSLSSSIIHSIPAHVLVSCTINFDSIDYNPQHDESSKRYIQSLFSNCKSILNQTKLIVVKIVSVDCVTNSVYLIAPKLAKISIMLQKLSELHPEKLLMVRVDVDCRGFLPLNLYCQKELRIFHEISEIYFQFFGLRNITFEMIWMAPVPHSLEQFGGWTLLRPGEELTPAKAKFPVFVARNHPPNFLLGEGHSDPCISWREDVPTSGIQIDPEYGGTTLYIGNMRNASLSLEELETLLLFTFHKFSLVELIPTNLPDLETVFEVLAREDFVKQLVFQSSDQPTKLKIFLRLDCNFFHKEGSTLDHYLSEKLKYLKLELTGVHFVNWTSCLDIPHWNQMNLTGINLGISLEDCLSEVNNDFENLHDFDFHEFSQVDYLLCNIKTLVNPTELSKEKEAVEAYLDSSLYIQRYFQRHFPNLNMEIMFRLNVAGKRSSSENFSTPVPSKSLDVFYFLRLFSDVAQYARLYKMKFFMFSAFDDETSSRFGWWRILQYEDLSNYSVFIEKEAEHFGRESWTPPVEAETVMNLAKMIIFGMGGAIAILVTAFFVLYIRYQRRFALLTKAEVDDFWRGSSSAESSGEENPNKFPVEFVIPKIELIGKGNFGLVYDATLLHPEGSGSDSVAVKIPHPDCSKESFKCMLSELKLLCYVGSHSHVLQFVGAYVRQIGRGILYIVTELCENGSLQNYLRKLDREMKEEREDLGSEEVLNCKPNFYELCRFAHEIAQGMEYISNKKIVHGDLATRNVLLDLHLSCKIADFGLSARLCKEQDSVKIELQRCPWRWMAPESLLSMMLTSKSDVWSYGITLWEIFSLGCIPYPGVSWTAEFTAELHDGMRLSSPQFASAEIYGTMLRCWANDPEERPGFQDLSQYFADALNKEYTQL